MLPTSAMHKDGTKLCEREWKVWKRPCEGGQVLSGVQEANTK